jgi:glycosyltransferase involved in cell wall biosynthesis
MDKRRLFFLTTDANEPSGGRKMTYNLVDLLVKNGFEAYALHQKMNFRYDWFNNNTPVAYTYQIKMHRARKNIIKYILLVLKLIALDFSALSYKTTKRVQINNNDILVIPCNRLSFVDEILQGVKKVILSQSPYLFFRSYLGSGEQNKFYHPDITALITMSKMNYELQRFCFPGVKIYNVPAFIDELVFTYKQGKKRQIIYMPRRNSDDSEALKNLLKYRDRLQGFSIVPVDNLTQEEVAQIYQDSLIFLSFSKREGFGLPPAEAMACGCIVIGYSGNGGDEFFHEDLCFKINEGDLLHYAQTVESVIEEYLTDPARLDKLRRRASDYILQTYSKDKTESILLDVWNEILT